MFLFPDMVVVSGNYEFLWAKFLSSLHYCVVDDNLDLPITYAANETTNCVLQIQLSPALFWRGSLDPKILWKYPHKEKETGQHQYFWKQQWWWLSALITNLSILNVPLGSCKRLMKSHLSWFSRLSVMRSRSAIFWEKSYINRKWVCSITKLF